MKIRYLKEMNFRNALPEFYEEIRSLLARLDRNDLLSQLQNLEIVWRCPCTEIGCASFKVSGGNSPDTFEDAGPKRSTYTSSINLNAERGKIILGLDQLGRITTFEVLNRTDIRRKLLRRH